MPDTRREHLKHGLSQLSVEMLLKVVNTAPYRMIYDDLNYDEVTGRY